MKRQHLMSKAVHHALVMGAAVATAGYASMVLAASSNTPAQLGKVTVTGTRIKRTNIETAQPITRISRQQIEQSGYTDLSQILGRLSSAGSHATATGTNSNAVRTVNLRNLGANRNLVLVNGKRWMQG